MCFTRRTPYIESTAARAHRNTGVTFPSCQSIAIHKLSDKCKHVLLRPLERAVDTITSVSNVTVNKAQNRSKTALKLIYSLEINAD